MKYHIFVSFIAYVHNGEGKVATFLKASDNYLRENFDGYEIILVNDGSTDATLSEAESASGELSGNLILINLPWRHGVEPAMTAGLHRSIGDFVFERDSIELDFPLDVLSRMYEAATAGFDIVSAATDAPRPLSSRLFYRFINRVSYVNLSLSSETIRLVSRRALNAMLNLKEKFRYRKALYLLTGYQHKNVIYSPPPGYTPGGGRMLGENVDLAMDVVIGFSNIGIRAIHYLTAFWFLFSVFMAGYTLFSWLFIKDIVRGWSSIMLFFSGVFAGLFFILGILGEYILRILNEVRGRPYYTVSSVKVYSESANAAKAIYRRGGGGGGVGPIEE